MSTRRDFLLASLGLAGAGVVGVAAGGAQGPQCSGEYWWWEDDRGERRIVQVFLRHRWTWTGKTMLKSKERHLQGRIVANYKVYDQEFLPDPVLVKDFSEAGRWLQRIEEPRPRRLDFPWKADG